MSSGAVASLTGIRDGEHAMIRCGTCSFFWSERGTLTAAGLGIIRGNKHFAVKSWPGTQLPVLFSIVEDELFVDCVSVDIAKVWRGNSSQAACAGCSLGSW